MERWQYKFLLRGDEKIKKLIKEGWIIYKEELGNTPLGPMMGVRLKRRGKKKKRPALPYWLRLQDKI